MAELQPVIGLKWQLKLPSFSDFSKPSSSSHSSASATIQNSALFMPSSQLVDGLYVPPNNLKRLTKCFANKSKTPPVKAGIFPSNSTALFNAFARFDMPAPVITPELKQDLKLLKLRSAMDPKRHYKKSEFKSKELPKYFQIGTVVEPSSEYYSSRLTRRERKATLADELLSDPSLQAYRKRKVQELEDESRPVSKEKWRNKGKQTQKHAKQRRHL